MFARAVAKAREFIRPVVIFGIHRAATSAFRAQRLRRVNKDGWVLTANHVVEQYAAMAAAKEKYADYLK